MVMVEPNRRALIIAMLASDPDIEYVVMVFRSLIRNKFPQCIHQKKETIKS